MVIVYIVSILAFLIFFISVFIDEESIISALLVGIIMGGLFWGLSAFVISEISDSYIENHRDEMVWVKEEAQIINIKTLSDKTGVLQGHFTLGIGNIETKSKFFFYEIYSDSTYKLKNLNASDVEIVESDFRNPCVVKYKIYIDWSRSEISSLLFKKLSLEYKYKIYVPKNTITVNYNLDTK